jgi:hypothetical protein
VRWPKSFGHGHAQYLIAVRGVDEGYNAFRGRIGDIPGHRGWCRRCLVVGREGRHAGTGIAYPKPKPKEIGLAIVTAEWLKK